MSLLEKVSNAKREIELADSIRLFHEQNAQSHERIAARVLRDGLGRVMDRIDKLFGRLDSTVSSSLSKLDSKIAQLSEIVGAVREGVAEDLASDRKEESSKKDGHHKEMMAELKQIKELRAAVSELQSEMASYAPIVTPTPVTVDAQDLSPLMSRLDAIEAKLDAPMGVTAELPALGKRTYKIVYGPNGVPMAIEANDG